MSRKSSFREALEQRDEIPVDRRGRSDSRAESVILEAGRLPRPVEVARVLCTQGLSLRKAHDAVNKLALRGVAGVALPQQHDRERLTSALLALGVTARFVKTPQVDPRAVREKLGLSQAEFATQFGLELDTVQNWEQGRNKPDRLAQTLLKIIEIYPQIVRTILTS